VLGPPPPLQLIGQLFVECDGSESSWGHSCAPPNNNSMSYSVDYYDDCDCGPDQQGALSKRACPRKQEEVKPAAAPESCEN